MPSAVNHRFPTAMSERGSQFTDEHSFGSAHKVGATFIEQVSCSFEGIEYNHCSSEYLDTNDVAFQIKFSNS
jgi:hypothetical protein